MPPSAGLQSMPTKINACVAMPRSEMALYSPSGQRKYVNAEERRRFLQTASTRRRPTRALCMLLVYTGCRVSEALGLSASSIQSTSNIIAIRSLKKRGANVVREVPAPEFLIEELQAFWARRSDISSSHLPLLPWKRTWAWMQVKDVMREAGIVGLHASPKGLRHGFGIHAVQSGVPLNLVQKWLGHAQLSTTAIYANALGPEEYAIAERMWQ